MFKIVGFWWWARIESVGLAKVSRWTDKSEGEVKLMLLQMGISNQLIRHTGFEQNKWNLKFPRSLLL
jgi:hypothetical protein